MINIQEFTNLTEHINSRGATLVAVSKTKPSSDIEILYEYGQRHFGENRVPELSEKHQILPEDIHWHMIGSLQRNKVKYIAPFVSLIHSVDSLRLLVEIDKQAKKCNRVIDCLLQFHIAKESTKSGLDWDSAIELLSSELYINMKNVRIVGVMGMATFTTDVAQIQGEFSHLKQTHSRLKELFFKDQSSFTEISMGMSGDYDLALEQGSTMVRIGSKLFGKR